MHFTPSIFAVIAFSVLAVSAAETPAYQQILQAQSGLTPLQSAMNPSTNTTATLTVETAAGLLKQAQMISEKIDNDQQSGSYEPLNNNAVWQVLMQAKGLVSHLNMQDPAMNQMATAAYSGIDTACGTAEKSMVAATS